ncbi:uncharacterized protein LOC8268394 [Ricinus communis]|uniref:RING finger protein n=1 Tax=Ricinus communis TaxID=3988 RepID=B9RJV1_RICCO|nr:uncharacterized protein LOC8268394 [Ricinus communis]EEF48603.1 conserved hypothetical protein [Ricinus communis]|eukprot:XP_002514020.1 uncharacterized protein LOC8268394 [Ricinus communis]
MEIEVSRSTSNLTDLEERNNKDTVRVTRKTLKTVLEQCQRALQLLSDTDVLDDDDDDDDDGADCSAKLEDSSRETLVASPVDREAYELCDLLKSRVECADFLQKLECAQVSVPQNIAEEGSSWDMVNENDLWEFENVDSDQEDYVLVRQEDIVEGIACFMAAYLLSVKQTKDLTPNQLQEALSKTFSVKKKKGKLRKAWDGSKVIYNVASWGATAIGIYQNPVILRAASKAFWTSCHVISKLL